MKNPNSEKYQNIINGIRQKFRLIQSMQKTMLISYLDDGIAPLDYGIMIFFSSAIATLGLIANMPAVTIGAQLIDPTITPLLGFSLAYLSKRKDDMRSAGILMGWGILGAVGCAALISLFTLALPNGSGAIPSLDALPHAKGALFEFAIALLGGSAAAYASARPRFNLVNSGVAIATAIMPPLCSLGIGISLLNPDIILGAITRFLLNFLAIGFAAILTYAFLGFPPTDK